MKNIKQLIAGFVGASSLFAASMTSVQAGENLWVYAKGTDVRPKGSVEVKIQDIIRIGKYSGDYTFHDIRPSIEYGFTDRLTGEVKLLIFDHDYSIDDPENEPMYETQGGAGGRFDETQVGGFELALKYNILSPYKDWIGATIVGAYERRNVYRLDGADIDQDSFVGKLYLQKNWIDNRLSLVLNGTMELERRTSPGVLEEEIAFDVSAGISYRFAPKHFIGFEYRRQEDHLSPWDTEAEEYDPSLPTPSEFDFFDFQVGSRYQYGEYIGPTYHYAEQTWWFTGGVLWQINGGGGYERNGKNFDEHERLHVGLFLGYEF